MICPNCGKLEFDLSGVEEEDDSEEGPKNNQEGRLMLIASGGPL